MALVCDIKSEQSEETAVNDDLEEGEIEDDDVEIPPDTSTQTPITSVTTTTPQNTPTNTSPKFPPTENKFLPNENRFGQIENRFAAPDAKFSDKFPHHEKVARFERPDRRIKHEDKKKSHMTEAEKSVMYLHRIERLEREKREKLRREQTANDDFASNIEKAIANVLKKERPTTDEEKEDDKRGKKRKKKDKERKKPKKAKAESPKLEEIDESEMLNMRGPSPEATVANQPQEQTPSPHSEDYDSAESEYSSGRDDKRERKKEHYNKKGSKRNRGRERKYKDRNREQRGEVQLKDSQNICVFYMQGKCHKGEECPYSHEVLPPMKLELCKFYLMECCAKGDKCLYMHSEFPCKYYHLGIHCYAGENCKFAHGKPLSDGLKQILLKHIETAPKEILGDFPRLNRDGVANMMDQAQIGLEAKYKKDGGETAPKSSIPSLFDITVPVPAELMQSEEMKNKEKGEKPAGRERNRPSRWQDPEPTLSPQEQRLHQLQMGFTLKGFYSEQDQDMRINSNGDIDMRTLPPQIAPVPKLPLASHSTDNSSEIDLEQYKREAGLLDTQKKDSTGHGDLDIRAAADAVKKDTDIRKQDVDARSLAPIKKDIDVRHFAAVSQFDVQPDDQDNNGLDDLKLEIVTDDDNNGEKSDKDKENAVYKSQLEADSRLHFNSKDVPTIEPNKNELPATLPKKQRELFLRIQSHQKDTVQQNVNDASDNDDNNVDWYSDDDDDFRLTIKDDVEEAKPKAAEESEPVPAFMSPPQIKPVEVMEKLGDLSKIDISAEVTKLLSTISQAGGLKDGKASLPRDPRLAGQSAEPPKPAAVDPRKTRQPSIVSKPKTEKLSIYEQGSFSLQNAARDVDLRNVEKDLDLRFRDTDLRSTPGRTDIDLRQLNLPFKAMQNYTPASEIDASIGSHCPITWRIQVVEVPRPDYTGLKLSIQDAQTTGDPRLRKIFRLSTEEKDSPASPKRSPKASSTTTTAPVDPRRRKVDEMKHDPNSLSYTQQLNLLQSSAFYQNLTSNEKLSLNQKLASKVDGSGSNDVVLNGILSRLGLLQGAPPVAASNPSAVSILSNLSPLGGLLSALTQNATYPGQNANLLGQNQGLMGQNTNFPNQGANLMGQNQGLLGQTPNILSQSVNPNILAQNPSLINQMAQSIVQPGLLGAAPGIPNLPPDFQINFDPRNGGLLGNAPPFQSFNENSNYDFNFGNSGGGRNERNFSRDRPPRRGRNFNNRNNARNFRNRNRSNRSHTPP